MRSRLLLTAVSLTALMAGHAFADTPAATEAATDANDKTVSEVVVTAQRLNEARQAIQPALGASTYTVTNAAIQALPGGDNQQLNQVILQAPGVVQDGFGQLHIRGDHNNLQYRLNGVILPEGISVFGQTLSPRLVGKLDLITGAMPAQYGLRTAGVVDISTKSGLFDNGGEVSVYGGSHGLYEPSFEYGGSTGATNYFISGDYRRSQLGIESVDGSSTPDHDRTDQGTVFGYVDHIISDTDRVSFTGGYSNSRFQIPNPRGLQPDGTYTLNGQTAYPSELLDETQRETTGFGVASWLHDSGKLTWQTSLFARYSTLTYRPDTTGELLYNGIAQAAAKRDFAAGIQTEGVYRLTDAHTLRGGVIIQGGRGTSKTTTEVFPGAPGAPTSDVPVSIIDNGGKTQWTYSAYLQDEWKLNPDLTLNYGLRYDRYDGFRTEDQLSPRVNLVWTPTDSTTVHAGYSRYFTPPPFELVSSPSVAKFAGTTGEAPGTLDVTPYAERQNYFDIGVEQKIGAGLTVGLDTYYRKSRNLIDEGQFGAPIIQTPFNYRDGRIYGVELSANYARGPITAYANLAYSKAQGRDIISSQFNFDPADLAYIQDHYIYLDHDQTWTGSAGASYRFEDGPLSGTQVSADALYGSGLRADGAVPNGEALADYIQVNASVSHKFNLPKLGALEARLDVINVFDKTYEIRDGSGIGVGAPQYGPGRGVFVGLTKSF